MSPSPRAVFCDALGPDLSGVRLRETEARPPGSGEVAIAVRAAALNFPDLLMTRGAYQHKPAVPFVLGMEGAGEVVEIGAGVSGARRGERVCFLSRTGACAERVVLPALLARRMPVGFDFAQAAAYQVGALTAYVALVRRAGLQPGEALLVHGASGGMGLAAVQLGRHLGATVIATGTSPEKLAVVTAHGAHHVIDSTRRFREEVKALTAGRGADVIFDPVGGGVFDESVRSIAWGGRLLVIGFASGRIPTLAVNLALIKGFSVVGVRAGEFGRRDPVKGAENLREIDRLAAAGVFTPYVGARFPLNDAVAALRALANRSVAGKIVIEI